jgi:hypothetical protein
MRPLKLFNAALLQSLKKAILEQNRLDLRKNTNFGPQNDDFSKMWPSSQFGLAMAVLVEMLVLKDVSVVINFKVR